MNDIYSVEQWQRSVPIYCMTILHNMEQVYDVFIDDSVKRLDKRNGTSRYNPSWVNLSQES